MQQPELPVLATGYIKLHDYMGNTTLVRALFDPGAESNLIEEQLIKPGVFKKLHLTMSIGSITGDSIQTLGMVNAKISPWFDKNGKLAIFKTFMIVKKLPLDRNEQLPKDIPEFKDLLLADPFYSQPGRLQLILNVGIWAEIVQGAVIKNNRGLCAEKTSFGYVIYGGIDYNSNNRVIATQLNIVDVQNKIQALMENHLEQRMVKFWELEEGTEELLQSPEDLRAEKHFVETTFRDVQGRYVVRLPLREQNNELGESRGIALNRFYQLERRLEQDAPLQRKYHEFMQQYIELKHMRLATRAESRSNGYYIPHHPIVKKFRVVFDASCSTSNGLSVNDIQLAGPNLQEELPIILMRFRMFQFVLVADINKVFRQIKMHVDDIKYQKIFWRFDAQERVKEYVLTTVTYGFKSSPFLAIRVLLLLAEQLKDKYPLAVRATRDNRYMDDYMSGAEQENSLLQLYHQLNGMMGEVCMKLGKWKTNSPKLIEQINESMIEEPLELSDESESVLGLKWLPNSDCFIFRFEQGWAEDTITTKRTILSAVFKIYDPTGFLAPIVIRAKSYIKQLWIQKLKWDQPVPEQFKKSWMEFYNNLRSINELKIPRWLHTKGDGAVKLFGFCDASEFGMGAVIYLQYQPVGGNLTSQILTSKSRIAPIKPEIIHRLELCAAVILAKLMAKMQNKSKLEQCPYFLYSDNTPTLYWIQSKAAELKTYVGNRVAKIQMETDIASWNYISTNRNPADIVSRGLKPGDLINCDIWWHGPSNLEELKVQNLNKRAELSIEENQIVRNEQRPATVMALANKLPKGLQLDGKLLIERFSDLGHIIRVTAWVKLFILIKLKMTPKLEQNAIGHLKKQLQVEALNIWIRHAQLIHLKKELMELSECFRIMVH